ncbi:MAG TPA: chorismate mutase [Candidatus Limnocylindrales bacterium]
MAEGRGRAGRGPGRELRAAETPELRRLRRRIDALDQRIVALLNERTALGLETAAAKVMAGRRTLRDPEREREVLMRVALANRGPLPQAELLALYRRLMAVTRELEARQRAVENRAAENGAVENGAGAAGAGDDGGTTDGGGPEPRRSVREPGRADDGRRRADDRRGRPDPGVDE